MIYDIIQCEDIALFKTAVQKRLDKGWELAGGVSFTNLKFTKPFTKYADKSNIIPTQIDGINIYTQAIYLDDEKDSDVNLTSAERYPDLDPNLDNSILDCSKSIRAS